MNNLYNFCYLCNKEVDVDLVDYYPINGEWCDHCNKLLCNECYMEHKRKLFNVRPGPNF